MTWNIPSYPLRWSLTLKDGSKLDTLVLKPILHGDHAAVLDKHEDDDDRLLALLELATGVPVETLEKLRRPDYNSLAKQISDLVTQDAVFFMDADRAKAQDPDAPELLHPIDTGDRKLASLTLEVPTLKASRMMRSYSTARERAEFITAHCTGLMLPDLALLSVPDWNTLQGRINDFLNEPAASFPLAI